MHSINKQFDAVLILTQHKGSTYVIVYATDLGRMGDYIGTFQNILSSAKFGSATYTGGYGIRIQGHSKKPLNMLVADDIVKKIVATSRS